MRKLLCAAVILAATLAACSSSGTGSTVAVKVSGTETFAGSTTSTANHPVIPLKASGVFADSGHITLGANSSSNGTLNLAKGVLDVRHSKGARSQSLSQASCRVTGHVSGTYAVTGGTGAYKGASGHGKYVVTFAATARKKASGKCGSSTAPGSTLTTFTAHGPLTIKK